MENTEIRTQAFTVTMTDHLRYVAGAYYRGMIRWPYCLYYLFCIFLPSAGFASGDLLDGDYTSFIAFTAGFLLLWLTVVPALTVFTSYRATRKVPGATGARTVTLTADDVTIEGEGFVVRQDWSAFREVRRPNKTLQLINRYHQAFLVKPEAFATREQADQAYELARLHIRNASHKHVATFYEKPKRDEDLPGLLTQPFRLTFGTYVVYALPIHYRVLVTRPMMLLPILSGTLVLPLWLERDELMAGDTSSIGSAITSSLIICALMPVLQTLVIWIIYRNKPGFRTERRVGITPESVWTRGDSQEATIAWRDIRGINRYFGCIVFRMGAAGGILVLESAFSDTGAADAFVAQARTYWKAAHGK